MDVEINRQDYRDLRTKEGVSTILADGQVRARVDAFGLSANNISYAAFGDMLRYWDFFPAEEPFGRTPVWGFATITESEHPDVAVGTRIFGYYPMSTEIVMDAGKITSDGFSDVAEHRAHLAGPYNFYLRTDADPIYTVEREAHEMLLYPLFFTSFVIDDYLKDNGDFGAEQFVCSSASSKTAIGLAHLLFRRGLRVIGLTSAGNRSFVESLGVYADVLTYDEIDSLALVPSVNVNFAGNQDVLVATHKRLEEVLVASMTVGGTHWDHQTETEERPVGVRPEFFFAPSHIEKRNKELGRDELNRRQRAAWDTFVSWTDTWLEIHDVSGPDAVIATWRQLLAGEIDPRLGYRCFLTV